MAFSKNLKHCRRCILISRHLSNSAAGRDAGETSSLARKISVSSLNITNKTKMSFQNKLKFLNQLKDLFNKSNYEKNVQFILNSEWIHFLQKLTQVQLNTIRKYAIIDDSKVVEQENLKKDIETKKPSQINVPIITKKVNVPSEVTVKPVSNKTLTPTIKAETIYSFPQALTSLIPALSGKINESAIAKIPRWKTKLHSSVTKNSITSRTRHILNSITTANSSASKWRRIEDLIIHLDQFPEAKYHAVKDDGIRILLKTRQSTKDQNILGAIREALSVLGYIDPVPNRGIRILSIDGGGIRGVLVIEMLKKLEELTGKKVYEMFDYICGVSTGAILSSALAASNSDEGGHKRKSLNEISQLYKELSTKIFTQSTIRGTSNLVWSHAYYDTNLWEKILQDNFGDKQLMKTTRDKISPKFSAISVIVNRERVTPYVFRNYAIPQGIESQYMGSYKHKIWEAIRASAAAPSYFEEFKCGDDLHQDGGIMVNNPCAVAIHEAKQLWPNTPIQCVVSFGTGRTPVSINSFNNEDKTETPSSSWKDKFYKILDSATDTEAVHIMLNDLLPDHAYYRFNPYLTEMLSMVEIRPEKISQLEQDARMYIRRNEEKFEQAAKILMQKKSTTQTILDWLRLQKQTFGT